MTPLSIEGSHYPINPFAQDTVMSAAYRFRSRAASSAIYRHYFHGGRSEKILSTSSRTLLPSISYSHQPKDCIVQLHRCSNFQARQISSSTYVQKSAVPIENEDDDNDTMGASSKVSNNTIPFLLADIGEGISEVELLQWYVSPGDTVSQFDRICEVQSDKATVEITSRFDGVVEQLCGDVGTMMFVGKPLLYIVTDNAVADDNGGGAAQNVADEGVANITQQAMMQNVDVESNAMHIPKVESSQFNSETYKNKEEQYEMEGSERPKVLSSPAVRKMSKDYNVDLATVLGTGPGGRVLKSDLLKIINANDSAVKQSDSPSVLTAFSESIEASQNGGDTVVPIRGYNRLMVKSMTASLQVPHMVYSDEVNVNAITEVRDSLRPIAKEMGVHLTYLPFFIKASSLAIAKYPVLNSTIDVEKMTLTYHESCNIGVAVDTERGLTVPVVKRCQDKSVLEIAEELGRLYSLVSGILMFIIRFFIIYST